MTIKTAKDVPLGAIIIDEKTTYNNIPIRWIVIDKNHYSRNEITLISEKALCEKMFDAEEENSVGNPCYDKSNILAWLNSSTLNWYGNGLHKLDTPPSYNSETGFLFNFSDDLYPKIVNTVLESISSNKESIVVSNLLFLPSVCEVVGAKKALNENIEGFQFEYFKQKSEDNILDDGTFATRTLSTDEDKVVYYKKDYSIQSKSANSYFKIRPVMNLYDDIEVKENKDGTYNFVFEKSKIVPIIPPANDISYEPINWEDDVTNLDAHNFNIMEQQIVKLTKTANMKSNKIHVHPEYSLTSHTHDNISIKNHSHDNLYAKKNHTHQNITSQDYRKKDLTPNTTSDGLYSFFADNSKNNIKEGTASGIIHFKPNGNFNNFTETPTYEIGITDSGKMYFRLGKNDKWTILKYLTSEDDVFDKNESDNRYYKKSDKIMSDKIFYVDKKGKEHCLKDILDYVVEELMLKAICGTFKAGEVEVGKQ